MRRPTRRELAALLAAMPIAAQNPLPPTQPQPPAANTLEKANGDVREAGEKLRAVRYLHECGAGLSVQGISDAETESQSRFTGFRQHFRTD